MAVAKEDIAGVHSGAAPVTHAHEYGSIGRWLVAPALIFAIVVTQVPFVYTLYYSTFRYNLLRPERRKFVGLENYRRILTDDVVFRDALVNTFLFTFAAVIISLLLGLFYAELVNHRFPGRGIVRTMLITPFLVMPLAGMQSIDEEVREAARVDGASPVQEFIGITLPHLYRFMQLGALLGTVYIVQEVDQIFMTTHGGPGTLTTNLPYYVYETAIRGSQVGRGAAIGVVVVILTIIAMTVLLRLLDRMLRSSYAGG